MIWTTAAKECELMLMAKYIDRASVVLSVSLSTRDGTQGLARGRQMI